MNKQGKKKQASKNLKLLADVNKEATQNIEDERAE